MLFAAVTSGCGGGDSTDQKQGPSSGGGAGTAGTGGSGGTAGSGGTVLDGGGGTKLDGGGGTAGSGGTTQDGGGGTNEAGTGCLSIVDCSPPTPYCDPVSGQCVGCKTSDPGTCAAGFYCNAATLTCVVGCDSPDDCVNGDGGALTCDPVTHTCLGCLDDDNCPPGSLCENEQCVPGCTPQHDCQQGFACCAGSCFDTGADPDHCGACDNACSFVNAIALCVAGNCEMGPCDPDYENCDQSSTNGCETQTTGGITTCVCEPNELQNCYEGAAGTENVGPCVGGQKQCNATGTAFGPCVGQVVPVDETCLTAEDDNCNGLVNEAGQDCVCPPDQEEACYTGPSNTRNVGLCSDGLWKCNAMGTAWSACVGEILPIEETCLTPVDDDCDGLVNEAGVACSCAPNTTQPCYSGPSGTQAVGACKAGVQTCDAQGTGFGPCVGDVLPSPDVCTDVLDNDCNGVANDGFQSGVPGCVCSPLSSATCYTGPAGTAGVGVCKAGTAICNSMGTAWGSCVGQVLPSVDNCTDTLDNDCSGVVNDGFGQGGQGCICLPGAQTECYSGPAGTKDVGVCHAGSNTCNAAGTAWGPCIGQIIPDIDTCLDSLDNDCNGVVNDGNHTAPGCACTPGEVKCVNDHELLCDALGDWGPPGGPCNQICKAGQFSCNCEQIMQCNVGPPATWVPKVPSTICNPTTGQRCNAATGTCTGPTVLGTSTPTGTYLQYAVFQTSGGVFKSGYDVDGIGDLLYVNRGGTYLDVYRVTILDSDGDGLIEPNQHPNNPQAPGPMEQRTLTFLQTYTKAGDNAPLSTASQTELFAGTDRIFSLGPTRNGDITQYIFATKQTSLVVDSATSFTLSQMAFADGENLWYGSREANRRVFSFCAARNIWVVEFDYPNLAGSHMDGLEAIVNPHTGEQYVYVSDMTSDFLGQYRRDATGNWVQENMFQYADITGTAVEGMGFGPLHHFWVTGGSTLIEIGGNDLTGYVE